MEFSNILDVIFTGVLRGGLYALMAVGLSLVFGVMNIPDFSHGEKYMLGAYIAYFAYTVFHLGPIPSILFAVVGTFILGVLLERGLFYPLRMRSQKQWVMNTFLLTLGISVIMQNTAKMLWGSTYRGIPHFWSGSVKVGTMHVAADRIVGFVIAVIAIAAFWIFLNNTRIGRAIRAVSQDETGAHLVGINLNTIHTLTYALSSSLAGLAGASLLSLTPASPMMGVMPLYKSWFVMILVGMGNVGASIWGGFIVGILETFSIIWFGAGWQDAVTLPIIILILLFRPSGLFARKGVKTVWE